MSVINNRHTNGCLNRPPCQKALILILLVLGISILSFCDSERRSNISKLFKSNQDHKGLTGWEMRKKFLKIGKKYRPGPPKPLSEGEQLIKDGKLDQAILYFLAQINIKPDSQAYNLLGYCYIKKFRPKEAIQAYQKALELSSDAHEPYNNLGSIYFRQGKSDLAEKNFLKAIALKPQYGEALANLAFLYHSSGQTKKALFYYQQAYEINPRIPGVKENILLLSR